MTDTLTANKVDMAAMADKLKTPLHVIQQVCGVQLTCDPDWQRRIDDADTFDDANQVYLDTPADSSEEVLALAKMIELASNVDKAREVFEEAADRSSDLTATAVTKWLELIAQNGGEYQQKDIEEVFQQCPEHSPEEAIAIRALATFFPKEPAT